MSLGCSPETAAETKPHLNKIRAAKPMPITRRQAVRQLSMWAAASPLLAAPQGPPREVFEPDRIGPVDELINAFEFEEVARKRLPETLYDHIAGGAGAERTLRRNREFFERITFRPRMLVDVSEMDLSLDLFGDKLFAPILVGPSAGHRRVHADAEGATVQGAGAAESAAVISRRSSLPIGEITAQAQSPVWFQADAETAADVTREEVKRAAEAGCKAICLTIGNSRPSTLERDVHNRRLTAGDAAAWPPNPAKLRERGGPRLAWELIDRVKEWSGLPVILKGVMSVDEASQAVTNGVDGLVVSNYGGRTIDGVAATIEVLPSIADEVEGRVPILVDGGFRRGVDILKGLALGANAILIGRPILWALAGYGAEGVEKLLRMLQMELALAMGLSGKRDLAAIDRGLVKVDRW